MKTFKHLIIILVLIAVPGIVKALADTPAPSALLLEADYAAFRAPDDSAGTYVEIFYTMHRNQLKYQPADTGYVAMIDFKMTLADENGKLIDSLSWKRANRIEKLSVLNDPYYLISDVVADVILPGHYIVNLYMTNEGHTGRTSVDMVVPSFKKGELALSTLELAYDIKPDSVGKFIKEGYKVMPNPSRQFLKENNVVYIYAEGYGLDTLSSADSAYTIVINILGSNGIPVKSLPASVQKKPGESAGIMTGFSIATFRPGQYSVKVDFSDGSRTVSSTKEFSVLGSPQEARQVFMQTLLQDFPEADRITDEQEAAAFRNDITYIATPAEMKLYDSLNLTGKSNFQKKFWEDRNPEPSSGINQYKLEHYRRLKYADSAWGKFRGGHAGWKTDRGRVYILYGEPDEIERYPSSLETRSWERWWYNGIEGGVYFVFVDFETSEDYKLVHSSKKNEISDPNWEDKIKMTGFQR